MRNSYGSRMPRLLALLALAVAFAAAEPVGLAADIEIYFSPHTDGRSPTKAVVALLDNAKTEVNVLAYSFTSKPIADALCAAKKRGCKVTVIIDSDSINKYTRAKQCVDAGCKVYSDANHAIAHNKVIVVDGKYTVTGSFNWSNAAEASNAENLLVIDDQKIAEKYNAAFAKHLQEPKTKAVK